MEPRPSRRNVLVGGAAVAAAVLTGCTSDDTADDADASDAGSLDQDQRSAVVIGAGLAGLTCALDLLEAGWAVTVIEAGDRVGGRVRTLREPFGDGLHAEAGGESIDRDHADLLALVDRFGLATEDRPPDKVLDGATWFRGRRQPTAEFVASDGGAVADYERFYAALDELSADIDPERPDEAAGAADLDARTMAELIDGLDLVPGARFLAETDIRSGFNADLDQLSQLFVAQQWAVGEEVGDEGEEAMRIRDGNDQLPEAMAAAVVELGGEVVLGTPVTAIVHDGDGVRVEAEGAAWEGAWAVVACPFTAARRIGFDPELPDELAAAIDGLELGPAAKVIVEYEDRFWEDGLDQSGFTLADEPFGVAWSPTDSYPSEQGLLAAFLTGSAAVEAAAQDDETRIEAVADQLARVYPEGTSKRTGAAATVAWVNEPFAGGGYAAYGPGQVTAFWAAIRAGTGRLRFAGEHTEALAGYMESAVRSGHRVAAELGDPPDD